MQDLQSFANQQLKFGGIVTSVVSKYTKRGTPMGIVTIEDYTGPGELALFGNDWAKWQNFMQEGSSLLIEGVVQPKRYNPSEFELHISNISFLSEVNESVVETLTIVTDLDKLNNDLMVCLTQRGVESDKGAALDFVVVDPLKRRRLHLKARRMNIAVDKMLTDYLDSRTDLNYQINGREIRRRQDSKKYEQTMAIDNDLHEHSDT